jgi:hypothetical protein
VSSFACFRVARVSCRVMTSMSRFCIMSMMVVSVKLLSWPFVLYVHIVRVLLLCVMPSRSIV